MNPRTRSKTDPESVWGRLTVSLLLLMTTGATFGAPEPWADPRLPVNAGLELWLDASRQNGARQTRLLPSLTDNHPVDLWFDGSGNRIDLGQRLTEARPHFKLLPLGAFIRFDGVNDSLAASNLRRNLTNASIFVVAAPRSNNGGFRAFLALNAVGRNDYTSGLNLDFGFNPTTTFSFLNAEGSGFQGVLNLMTNALPWGAFHAITLTSEADGIRLYIDGTAQTKRERTSPVLSMDELTIGARFFSNTPEPPHTQGWLDGDIAEVLVFSRALSNSDRAAVENYLTTKYSGLKSSDEHVPGGLRSLEAVTNPPAVQMFAPGFTVRELPLSLNNINNLKYRPDGKLVALGYNGRIYLLSDTDGDGLEDQAEIFWDRNTLRAPIGMALTPPGYARGEGVFVAGKGKVSLIVDRDHDGRADEEIIVADGWKELGHGVDALGVAIDSKGNVYFGLGCANFTDAYLIDKATGTARYDLKSERGTILMVSPDFSRREIVCTGIRFPVALAFNGGGDLFCTDQEGATWLPNGNPFDELLFIEAGRHYGFPPRHPKHLPSVIDEPSVFDYAPQHQSTCGLNFNEPVNGGAVFGPSWWAGDAIVSGYSRGKLFRTRLVKAPNGYLAQNQLISALNMLTVDATVSPRGDLVVATHSGSPDWGSGPDGKGKLYNISYTGKDAPQPVLAWAATPTEFHIAFDRPLDPGRLKDLRSRSTIIRGKYVSAGDRFESLRPGYQAVLDQLVTPRFDVSILGVNLSADRRTLILVTPPQEAAMNYAITLPRFARVDSSNSLKGELPQHSTIELASDLCGVAATLKDNSGRDMWSGWLPHVDLQSAQTLTAQTAEQRRLWSSLKKADQLVLRSQLDLDHMLQPSVQPGAQLDYVPPAENVSVEFIAITPFTLKSDSGTAKGEIAADKQFKLIAHPKTRLWPFELTLTTGSAEPNLQVAWFTSDDSRRRVFPLRRFLLPWATLDSTSSNGAPREVPELAGGNWLHGKRLFFGDQVACYKCHRIRGEGGKIGPDLSNLIFRDYASVLRDITAPNATINPDHLAWNIELKNGDPLTGVLESDTTNELVLGVVSGELVHVQKTQIASLKPSTLSLMPEGLIQAFDSQQLKDLMTFLLMSPLEPAPIEAPSPPPPRSRTEVNTVLGKQTPDPVAVRTPGLSRSSQTPLRILLSAGPKDHGPGEHDYPLWQKRWEKLLPLADNVEVKNTMGWPNAEQFASADVIVFYSDNPGWSAARAPELDAFLQRGGGLVYLHYAVDGHQNVDELSQRIGLAWRGGGSKFRHGPLDLELQNHPLAAGLPKLKLIDESYWQLVGSPTNIDLIASGPEEGKPQPLIWTREQGKGRVFVSIPGHCTWTFDDPLFRILILRGICWSAHQPIDRLAELATIGARIGD